LVAVKGEIHARGHSMLAQQTGVRTPRGETPS
jgi:hypothetical protein